jgi:hypothetical protein
MFEALEAIIPYMKGLWTLPWIGIGFLVTFLLSQLFDADKIDRTMKKIGLIILYFFVPLLLFRIFIGVDFHEDEIYFSIVCILIFTLMYIIAFLFARYKTRNISSDKQSQSTIIKTILTNQGRSSAFIGGSMLAISEWSIYAAIYMSIGAIFLFAIIPYILSYLHKKETQNHQEKITALPWYLRYFPWYLLLFALSAIILHSTMGISPTSFGNLTIPFDFVTSLTIPAALYYVGAGIHPRDLHIEEMKKIFTLKTNTKTYSHWTGVQAIIVLTVILTPLITLLIFGPLLIFGLVTTAWFSVIIINSILPITSTNMFLLPYGIDKKTTAFSVTWTTIICVPIVVLLIFLFTQLF